MRALILTICMALLSCGGTIIAEDCDTFSAGICFRSAYEVNHDHVTRLVDIAEEELLRWYPDTPDLPTMFKEHGVVVEIRNEYLSAHCTELSHDVWACGYWLDGANVNTKQIYIRYYDCIADTALIHELLHTYEWVHLGIDPPMDHSTPHLYNEWHNFDPDAKFNEIVEANTKWRFFVENPNCS